MRVGVIGPVSPDSMADNVLSGLADLGVEAVGLGPALPRPRSPLARQAAETVLRASNTLETAYQRRLVTRCADLAVDLVVSVDGRLLPEVVADLGRAGVRSCLWFPDHVANMYRHRALLAPYDAVFLKDPLLVDRAVRVMGLPAHYLPEACNPRWHRPPAHATRDPHVAVVGNYYGSRLRLLGRLVDAGVPLRLYGAPLPAAADPRLRPLHTGRVVVREEKAAVFRGAAAVLNNLHPAEMDGVNCRLFEAAGCGAAVLCERRPALDALFVPDQEVLSFADLDELVDRAGKLLADESLSTALGDAAALRAHGEHTYAHRLTAILQVVG